MDWLILLQKILASVFIVCIMVVLGFWCLPEGYIFRNFLHKRFGRFIYWAGLDNYWALFAPEPVSQNFIVGFELEFSDGTTQPWKLPQYILKDEYQYTRHFRFVKMHNQLLSQRDVVPREALCKYILREYEKHNGWERMPVNIHIIRYYEPADDKALLPWLSRTVFTYEVQLKRTEVL